MSKEYKGKIRYDILLDKYKDSQDKVDKLSEDKQINIEVNLKNSKGAGKDINKISEVANEAKSNIDDLNKSILKLNNPKNTKFKNNNSILLGKDYINNLKKESVRNVAEIKDYYSSMANAHVSGRLLYQKQVASSGSNVIKNATDAKNQNAITKQEISDLKTGIELNSKKEQLEKQFYDTIAKSSNRKISNRIMARKKFDFSDYSSIDLENLIQSAGAKQGELAIALSNTKKNSKEYNAIAREMWNVSLGLEVAQETIQKAQDKEKQLEKTITSNASQSSDTKSKSSKKDTTVKNAIEQAEEKSKDLTKLNDLMKKNGEKLKKFEFFEQQERYGTKVRDYGDSNALDIRSSINSQIKNDQILKQLVKDTNDIYTEKQKGSDAETYSKETLRKIGVMNKIKSNIVAELKEHNIEVPADITGNNLYKVLKTYLDGDLKDAESYISSLDNSIKASNKIEEKTKGSNKNTSNKKLIEEDTKNKQAETKAIEDNTKATDKNNKAIKDNNKKRALTPQEIYEQENKKSIDSVNKDTKNQKELKKAIDENNKAKEDVEKAKDKGSKNTTSSKPSTSSPKITDTVKSEEADLKSANARLKVLTTEFNKNLNAYYGDLKSYKKNLEKGLTPENNPATKSLLTNIANAMENDAKIIVEATSIVNKFGSALSRDFFGDITSKVNSLAGKNPTLLDDVKRLEEYVKTKKKAQDEDTANDEEYSKHQERINEEFRKQQRAKKEALDENQRIFEDIKDKSTSDHREKTYQNGGLPLVLEDFKTLGIQIEKTNSKLDAFGRKLSTVSTVRIGDLETLKFMETFNPDTGRIESSGFLSSTKDYNKVLKEFVSTRVELQKEKYLTENLLNDYLVAGFNKDTDSVRSLEERLNLFKAVENEILNAAKSIGKEDLYLRDSDRALMKVDSKNTTDSMNKTLREFKSIVRQFEKESGRLDKEISAKGGAISNGVVESLEATRNSVKTLISDILDSKVVLTPDRLIEISNSTSGIKSNLNSAILEANKKLADEFSKDDSQKISGIKGHLDTLEGKIYGLNNTLLKLKIDWAGYLNEAQLDKIIGKVDGMQSVYDNQFGVFSKKDEVIANALAKGKEIGEATREGFKYVFDNIDKDAIKQSSRLQSIVTKAIGEARITAQKAQSESKGATRLTGLIEDVEKLNSLYGSFVDDEVYNNLLNLIDDIGKADGLKKQQELMDNLAVSTKKAGEEFAEVRKSYNDNIDKGITIEGVKNKIDSALLGLSGENQERLKGSISSIKAMLDELNNLDGDELTQKIGSINNSLKRLAIDDKTIEKDIKFLKEQKKQTLHVATAIDNLKDKIKDLKKEINDKTSNITKNLGEDSLKSINAELGEIEAKINKVDFANSNKTLKINEETLQSLKNAENTVNRLNKNFSTLNKESNEVGKNTEGLKRLNLSLEDIEAKMDGINKKGIVDESQVEKANALVAELSSKIGSLNQKAIVDLNQEDLKEAEHILTDVTRLISQISATSKDMKIDLDIDKKLESAMDAFERFSNGIGSNFSGLKELEGFLNSISSMPIDMKSTAIDAFNEELKITEANIKAVDKAKRDLSNTEATYKGFINTGEVENIRKSIEGLSNLNTSKTSGEIDKITASITNLSNEGKRLKLEDSSFKKTESAVNKARKSLDDYAKSIADVKRTFNGQSEDIFRLFNYNEANDAKNVINNITDAIVELQNMSDEELIKVKPQQFEEIKSGINSVKKSLSDMVSTARKELNSMNKFFDMENSFNKFLNKNQKTLDAKDVNIVKNLKSAFNDLSKATTFESMQQKLKEFQQQLDATGIKAKELSDNLKKNLDMAGAGLDYDKQIGRISNIEQKYGSFVNIEEMQKAKMLASELKKYLTDTGNFNNAEAKIKMKELSNAIKEVEDSAKKASKEMEISNGVKKMAQDIENLRREGKITSQQADELYKSLEKINKLSTDEAEKELRQLGSAMSQMQKDTKFLNKSFGKEFFSDLYFNLRTFQLGRLIGDGIRRAMYQVKEIIISMDDAMREVRKVAEAEYVDSPLKLDIIKKDAIEISKTLGVASNDFLTSLSTTIKLGFSDMKQATEIARNTMMLANVGDIGAEEASQAVATLVNAWNLDTVREYRKEVDGITQSYTQFTEAIDLVNYIGNTRPIDTAGVLDAMKASSNVAKQFGINMYELSGFITAANSTIQDANKVGTGMRALTLRMSGVDYDDSEGDTAYNKIGKAVKNLAGIDIFSEDKKSLKSMTKVFEELATKWDSFDDATQKTLAKTIGGQRQSETFLAIMNNYDMYKDIVAELNQGLHLGSATKENEQYIDSISGKLAQLKNTWTDVITSIFESESIKGFIDMANTALEGVARIMNALKDMNLALPATLALLMGSKGILKFLADKGLGFALSSVLGKIAKTSDVSEIGKAAQEVADGMAKTSSSSVLAFTGLMQFAKAIPIVLAVAAAIFVLYKNLEKANKMKAEQLDVSISNRKSTVKSLKEESKKVTELSRRYKELASKKELTKDEQTEFANVKEQIQAVSPDSVEFDAEGNITSVNISNLDSLRDNLKIELERETFTLDAEINARYNLAELDSTGNNKAIEFTKEWFQNEIGKNSEQRLQEIQRKYDAIIGDGIKYNATQTAGAWLQRATYGSGFIEELLKYGRILPEISNGTSEAIDNIIKSGNYSQENIKRLNKLQQKELTAFKTISSDLLEEINLNTDNAKAYQDKIGNDLSKTSWFNELDNFSTEKVNSVIASMNNINAIQSNISRSEFLNTLFKGFEENKIDLMVFEASLKDINTAFADTGNVEAFNEELSKLGNTTAFQAGLSKGSTAYTDFVNSFYQAFKNPTITEEYKKLTDHIGKLEKESESYISKIQDALKLENKQTMTTLELGYIIESSESPDKLKEVAKGIKEKLEAEAREFTTSEENNILFTYMYNWDTESANIEKTIKDTLNTEEFELYVNEINRLQKILEETGDTTASKELERNLDALSRKTGLEKKSLEEYIDLVESLNKASSKWKREIDTKDIRQYSYGGNSDYGYANSKFEFDDNSTKLQNKQLEDFFGLMEKAPTDKLKEWNEQLLSLGYTSNKSLSSLESSKFESYNKALVDYLANDISNALNINKDVVLEGINLKLDENSSGIDLSYSINDMIKKVTSKNNEKVNIEVQTELEAIMLDESTPDIIKKQIEMALYDGKVTIVELEGILDLSMKVNANIDTSDYEDKQKAFEDDIEKRRRGTSNISKVLRKDLNKPPVKNAETGDFAQKYFPNISEMIIGGIENGIEDIKNKKSFIPFPNITEMIINGMEEEINNSDSKEINIPFPNITNNLIKGMEEAIEEGKLSDETNKVKRRIEDFYNSLSQNSYGSLLKPTLENGIKTLPKELSSIIEGMLSNDEFSKEEYELLLDVTAKFKDGEIIDYKELEKQLNELNNYAGTGTGVTLDVEGKMVEIDTGTEKPVIDVLLNGTLNKINDNTNGIIEANNESNSGIFKNGNFGYNENGVLSATKYKEDIEKKKKSLESLLELQEKSGDKSGAENTRKEIKAINDELASNTFKNKIEAEKKEQESYNDVLKQSAEAYNNIEKAKADGTWDSLSEDDKNAMNASLESALTNLKYIQDKYGSGIEIEIDGKVSKINLDTSTEDLGNIKKKIEEEIESIEGEGGSLSYAVEGSDEAKKLEETLANLKDNLSTVETFIKINSESEEEVKQLELINNLLGEDSPEKDINVNTDGAITSINSVFEAWNNGEFEEKTLTIGEGGSTGSKSGGGISGFFSSIFGGGKNKNVEVDVTTSDSSITQAQNTINGLKQTETPPIDVDPTPANSSIGSVKVAWAEWNPAVKKLSYNITETKTVITNNQQGTGFISNTGGFPVGDNTAPAMLSTPAPINDAVIQPRSPVASDGDSSSEAHTPSTFASKSSGWTTPVRVHNKAVDYLVYGVNLTTELENKIKSLANQLDLLDAKMEHAFGKKKINYMKEQIKLLEKQKQLQKDLVKQLETEQSKLKSFLSSNGFKFDAEGGVTNYVAKLMEMNRKLDSIKNEKEYEKYQNNLDELTKALERYLDITFNDLPDAIIEWEDLENQIKDVYKEQLDIAKETEDKLMEIYKKQIDDHKEMLEKQNENTIKALEKRVKAEVDAINEIQKAYNKARDEEDYQEELAKKREDLYKIEKQIALASRDTSTAGKAKLDKLMEEYDNLKDDLDDFLQDREDKLVNDMFDDEKDRLEKESDKEIERLEKELEDALKKLEETFTDEKLMEMIKDAISTGQFTGIDGSVSDLNEVMLQFLNSTTEGLGATGQIIKNEWIGNLEIAKDVLKDIDNIVKELDLEKFHNNNDMFSPETFSVSSQQSRTVIPQDMNVQRFIDGVTNASGKTVNFNQPLIQIEGNVTEDVMPKLEKFARDVEKRITNNIVYAMR